MSNPEQEHGPAALTTPASGAKVVNPKRRQLIVLSVFLVIVAAFIGVAVYFTRNSPDTAKVGDCVRQDGADSVQVVDCADPAAAYKVVGRVEDKTQVQASISACDAFPDSDSYFWLGKPGGSGFVLCLASTKG